MSSLTSGTLSSTVAGQITSTLLPTVTKIDNRDDSSSLSIVVAFSIVFVLAPVTISGNTMILAAFYRYKRLRTASNCLLASLAVSDFGVGVFMPFGVHLELSGIPENGVTSVCIVPYCIVIALCSVSVLITVAIAVDRLTSLAQPLRYKNIITHSSVEKYIAVFWIYAIAVGLSPLVYAQVMGFAQPNSGNCRFGAAVQAPVRVFLVVAVWAPSAFVLLGCYIYVYLVARSHARAIYTVELSFRHQTQTMALPRYGQTLAVTVGAFLILWLPFQACMLLDIFCGTRTLSEWSVVWLGLPILAHSGINPWIYAFHHGEMRGAAGKIAEDVVTMFGIHPSRYGCSPIARGGSNLELAEVNKDNDEQRPPVEDCFAAKHQSNLYPRDRRPEPTSSNDTDISPEGNDSKKRFSHYESQIDVVEENVHDLAKMLGPEYVIDRCHVIDSNHNVDKIKNLKYLLDPTFNKIRHLRRLNTKGGTSCRRKDIDKHIDEPKFTSYQNLKCELTNRRSLQLNALSDPMLNVETPCTEPDGDFCQIVHKETLRLRQRRDSGLASMSDPNIKAINLAKYSSHRTVPQCHRYSVQSLDYGSCHQQTRKLDRRATKEVNSTRTRGEIAARWRQASKQLTVTANKLSSFFHHAEHARRPINLRSCEGSHGGRKEYVRENDRSSFSKLLEPTRPMVTLTVPTIHSEPPSPVDPRPLDSLREEEPQEEAEFRSIRRGSKNSVRHSDPVPYVLLNIEDFDRDVSHSIDPQELANALAHSTEPKFIENLFPEHNSRFSSRRPSDLRWSEASRSQEVLSNVNEHQKSPSSYSVNNCNSSSDINEATCLDSFMCPDAISSSLRESFFEVPSIPDSDVFTSFEEAELKPVSPDPHFIIQPAVHSSVSSVNTYSQNKQLKSEHQSKSSESVILKCRNAILQSAGYRTKLRIKSGNDSVLADPKRAMSLAPLATPTPIDICTPTFEPSVDIKGTPGIGVRV